MFHRAALLSLPLAFAAAAGASPISFTYTGNASGSLNGVAFSASDFSIYATADTADRQTGTGSYLVVHSTASITIANLGTFDILTATSTAVNNASSLVVFGNHATDRALLIGTDNAYTNWDLLSSLGPISGDLRALQWADNALDTTGGQLQLDNATFAGTFEAAVPAPATFTLVGASVLAFRRRR